MKRATYVIVAIVLVWSEAAAAPLVTYESPCECRDNHGKARWAEKNDPALPPADASAIQTVTPPDLISDAMPFGHLWYAGPNTVANAIGYAEHRSRSLDAVIRVYDEAGNVIGTRAQGPVQRAVTVLS
jgi:hypothetical protein